MSSKIGILFSVVVMCSISVADVIKQSSDYFAPEIATGRTQQALVKATNFIVTASNIHAVKAGYQILKLGGSAVDAMIATQLVLNLVEPQSSGIGGGAFVLHYDGKVRELTSWDGRETAPQAVTTQLFLNASGEPKSFYNAVNGGLSVGTPGTLKLIYELHKIYGKLNWKTLFQPAIELATKGFIVSPRLAKMVENSRFTLSRYHATENYFFPNRKPIHTGYLLKNYDFAKTLKLIAEKGIEPFYVGSIAHDIVRSVRSVKDNPGLMTLKDLESYQVVQRTPVCQKYREFEVCGMGPPSSGGVTIGQILGMLEPFNLKTYGLNSVKSLRLIGDASRLAFADRSLYLADPDFFPISNGLLDKVYLHQRSRLLVGSHAIKYVSAGEPPDSTSKKLSSDESMDLPSTSHISIVDAYGSALSMTTSIENSFGSKVMTGGFMLNNQLTDFSFRSSIEGKVIANRVEPGKRPRSSMSPTIVFKDNKPLLVIGATGGSRIIGHVIKALTYLLDFNIPLDEAINMPNWFNGFGTYYLEKGTNIVSKASALKKLGYSVEIDEMNSGMHGIVITDHGLLGAADSRREGIAMGD